MMLGFYRLPSAHSLIRPKIKESSIISAPWVLWVSVVFTFIIIIISSSIIKKVRQCKT